MTAVMMASGGVPMAAFVWMAAFVGLVLGFAFLMSKAKTRLQRMAIFAAAAVLTAILITGTQAKADDFPCSACCAWVWFC